MHGCIRAGLRRARKYAMRRRIAYSGPPNSPAQMHGCIRAGLRRARTYSIVLRSHIQGRQIALHKCTVAFVQGSRGPENIRSCSCSIVLRSNIQGRLIALHNVRLHSCTALAGPRIFDRAPIAYSGSPGSPAQMHGTIRTCVCVGLTSDPEYAIGARSNILGPDQAVHDCNRASVQGYHATLNRIFSGPPKPRHHSCTALAGPEIFDRAPITSSCRLIAPNDLCTALASPRIFNRVPNNPAGNALQHGSEIESSASQRELSTNAFQNLCTGLACRK